MTTTHAQNWYCPVCGYDLKELMRGVEIPQNNVEDTSAVFNTEICPCCGIQFGNDDWELKERKETYNSLRKKWIQGGMKWGWSFKRQKAFDSDKAPSNWNPLEQLKNIPREFLNEGEKY